MNRQTYSGVVYKLEAATFDVTTFGDTEHRWTTGQVYASVRYGAGDEYRYLVTGRLPNLGDLVTFTVQGPPR